jgi:hypothetical protein
LCQTYNFTAILEKTFFRRSKDIFASGQTFRLLLNDGKNPQVLLADQSTASQAAVGILSDDTSATLAPSAKNTHGAQKQFPASPTLP